MNEVQDLNTQAALLEARNLHKAFKGMVAVDDVSFSLNAGECVALVGESGCGKSTVARMVTGLMQPNAGEVRVRNEVVSGADVKTKRLSGTVQMVFQQPTASFDPRRSLGHGASESLVNRGVSRQEALARVAELFELCELSPETIGRYPHQVSGGQCQRAAIARALAGDPDVLVCDEATSGLDVTVQRQVISLLSRLRDERGLSLLFICHDLALVQNFADRILVMDAGRLVEEGTPDGVIFNPQSPAARRLVDSVL